MRTLVIGDVHGCTRALDCVIDAAQPATTDRLVMLGDYIDRGPDSRGVIDRLLYWQQQYNLICLQGNHEELMLNARNDNAKYRYWRMVGGDATVASYAGGTSAGSYIPVPQDHWHFLEHHCQSYFETDTHIFVHAGVDPKLLLAEQEHYVLRWMRFDDPPPHVSGKIMICGHTAQESGRPRNIGHAICIDTRVHAGGWLTCLEVETGRMWQANQQGHLRLGNVRDDLVGNDFQRRTW